MSDTGVETDQATAEAAGPGEPSGIDGGTGAAALLRKAFLVVPTEAVLAIVIVGLALVFTLGSDFFLTVNNARNILLSIAVMGILASPATLLLVSGNFDLSIASTAAFCGVVTGLVVPDYGVAAGIGAALAVGILAGVINGALSAYAGIASIIVTLGTWQAFRGLARVISNGQTLRLDRELAFVTARIAGVPSQVIVFAVVTVIAYIVVKYTRFGRSVYAIGSNPVAARLSGLREKPAVFSLFVVSGLLSAVAGLIIVSQLDAASPNAAQGVELRVVAAVILGGASLKGGRGTIFGTLLAVVLLGILQNGLTLLGISSFWQDVATGAVLVIAVGLDQVRLRLSKE